MRAKDLFTSGCFPSHSIVDDHLVTKRTPPKIAILIEPILIPALGTLEFFPIEEDFGKLNVIKMTGAGV